MNLPEGVLRERLRLAFAKATGTFDEFDLLSVVGRSQIGRIRYTGDKEQLHEDVPFQSVDEILERKRGGELFRYLLDKFATFSGISGVQPKILVRDEEAFDEMEHTGHRLSQSCKGATHIVKLWEPNEYPQLAANEYFCLMAARGCGLDVPRVDWLKTAWPWSLIASTCAWMAVIADSRISACSTPGGRMKNIAAATRAPS
jgi:serine/threonine-protein kinase HipA